MSRPVRQHRDGQGDGSWYRISNLAGSGPAQIMIYDEIGFWGVTAQDFLRDLAAISGPVDIHINSPGGDVFDAFAIYNALASRPGVTTYVDALAASSASVIAMSGEQRLMARTSQMMIHDGWSFADGNADDMTHLADRLNQVSGQIADVYAATAGGTQDHWRTLMKAETWFTPEAALEAGLITGIQEAGRGAQPPAAAASLRPAGAILGAAAPQAKAIAYVKTATDDGAWDGPAAQARITGDGPHIQEAMRAACAWVDPDGDPQTKAAYKFIHHQVSEDGTPGAASVKACTSGIGVLNGGRGGTTIPDDDRQGVYDHLAHHLRDAGEDPPALQDAAPASASAAPAPANQGRKSAMPQDPGALTIESRRSRIAEIEGRCQEITAAYPASLLPTDVQTEWDRLQAESTEHRAVLEHVEARNAQMAALAAPLAGGPANGGTPGAGGLDRPVDSGGRPAAAAAGVRGTPAFRPQHDIYDLVAIRNQARNAEELPGLYKQNALRAIDQHRFPGHPDRAAAQAAVAQLLDTVGDDREGRLARRILATGSPGYLRVFGRALAAGNPGALGSQDAQILALGESDTGAYAVPFQLDPTIILTSDGVINPLRQISRVERIVGKEYDLVTSAGVTVTRVAESTEATDNTPVLAQPTVKAERVQGFIKFTVELEGDWTNLQAEMMRLLTAAKDEEEGMGANGFLLGDGTAPAAGGVVTMVSTMNTAASVVQTASANAFTLADLYGLKNALPPRFRARGQFLGESSIYDLARQFANGDGNNANVWAPSLRDGNPDKLIGYPANEASAMADDLSDNALILLFGDFQQFLIVDRVGMNMELIPHLLGTNRRPTGERGYFCWWRNNSVVLTEKAFRILKVKAAA